MKVWIVCKSETNTVDGWCRVFRDKDVACRFAYGTMLSELESECNKETVVEEMGQDKNSGNLIECLRRTYEHMTEQYINIYEEEIEV